MLSNEDMDIAVKEIVRTALEEISGGGG
jgi:hypothetical protein